MKTRTYFKIVFGMAGGLLFFTVAFNFAVNPLGIYGTPVIQGLNDEYPAVSAYLRIHKTEKIKQLKPDTVITGSSRALIGLNAAPELFPAGRRIYNLGLTAPSIHEQRRMMEFAHRVSPLKQAVITLDFFSFMAGGQENRQFDEKRVAPAALVPWRRLIYRYDTVATLDVLVASVKHLRYLRRPEKQSFIRPDGRMQNNNLYRLKEIHGAAHVFKNPPVPDNPERVTFSYSDKPGDTSFRHLDAMLDMARRENIDIVLLLSPVHETLLKKQEENGIAPFVAEWKQRVEDSVRTNALRYQAAPYPLWDFYDYSSITTEPVAAKGEEMRWFTDSSHYTPEAGEIVLRKVLGLYKNGEDPSSDFGRQLF